MASNQQFCLRWNNHQSTLISVFDHLLESGTLVDCTLAADGQFLKAHKVVLSACSPYLEAILSQHYEKHPILILKDITFHELKSMLDYMYRGEVNISQEQLGTFLKAAESLQIKGLTDNGAMTNENRDLDRARDLEHSRVDRALGGFPKRMDIRKQIPILPRPRSPLIGIPPNMIHTDHRKSNKHPLLQDVKTENLNTIRNREGSVSPTAKRKRSCPTYIPLTEETIAPKLVENNHEENNHNDNKSKETSPVPPKDVSNCVQSNVLGVKKQVDNDKAVDSEVIKPEVKSENMVDFSDEVHNDDSVEDLTVDEEEEEMDELDLSKPGPSTAPNSHVAGIPWHIAGEGNSEDMLLAGHPDSQGRGRRTMLGGEIKRSYVCGECGKTYTSSSSLRLHKNYYCGKPPQFACPCCPLRTAHKGNLKTHFYKKHPNEHWPYT